jgi:hypothetical protein
LLLASQVYGLHALLMLPEQEPLPSQVFSPEMPSPSQTPESQISPAAYSSQSPLPSHAPSWRQVDFVAAAHSEGSIGGKPRVTKLQSPRAVGRLHALHFSLQAEVQHTPSAQYPLLHSLSQVHASPFPFVAVPASPAQVVCPSEVPSLKAASFDVARESAVPPSGFARLPAVDLHALEQRAARQNNTPNSHSCCATAIQPGIRCSTMK